MIEKKPVNPNDAVDRETLQGEGGIKETRIQSIILNEDPLLTARKLDVFHRDGIKAKDIQCIKRAHEKMLQVLIFPGK